MVAKCANPSCAKQFHRFNEGKLFRFVGPARKEEYFWVCGACSATNTLMVDHKGKPVVEPISTIDVQVENSGSAPPAIPAERPVYNIRLHATRGDRYGMRRGRRG